MINTIDHMKIYTKNCPKCNNLQKYSSFSAFYIANKTNSKCKSCSALENVKRKGNLSLLEEESLEKYYWLGFILADGHISNNRLVIGLSKKDENFLKVLANKLKLNLKYYSNYSVTLAVMNKKIIGNLVKKYKIHGNKTYSPPDITSITGNNLIALSIGFIDGDGSIKNVYKRKDFNITIKVHKTWLNFLIYVFGKGYINNFGYAQTNISNTEESKRLKQFALDNNLPIMKRKWNTIDLNFKSKRQLAKERLTITIDLLQKNKSRKEIKLKTGLSDSGLSLLIKRNNL